MMRLFLSPSFTALTGCVLYLATTVVTFNSTKFTVTRPSVTEVKRSADTDPSWSFRNPELDQWISEIKQEKQALDLREQQLKELEVRLNAERQEIYSVTQSVHQLQTEFDKNVVRLKEQDMENLKRQAKLLAAMSPESAASTLNEMTDDAAVQILFVMKPDEASLMLDTLSKLGKEQAKRTAAIIERLRRALPPAPNKNTQS